MKTLQKTLIGLASLALLTGTTAPALANDVQTAPPLSSQSPSLTETDYQEIKEFWDTYSVPLETQDRLFASIERGEPTLATQGQTEPVSTETIEEESATVEVSRFSDGSVSTTSVERPSAVVEGQMGTRAVTGCSYSGGSGYAVYNNCTVRQASDAVTTSFIAGYQNYQGGGSQIHSYGPLTYQIRGGKVLSGPSVTRYVQHSSQYQEAVVTQFISVGYTNITGAVISTESVYLSLRVPYRGAAYSAAY